MNTNERREHIKATIEKQVDRANDILQSLITSELQHTVNQWRERYPNHSFTIELGMGLFSATVTNRKGDEVTVAEWGLDIQRGAFLTLRQELIELENWARENYNILLGCTGPIKST